MSNLTNFQAMKIIQRILPDLLKLQASERICVYDHDKRSLDSVFSICLNGSNIQINLKQIPELSLCSLCGSYLSVKYLDRFGSAVSYCLSCGESHEQNHKLK